MPRTDYYNSGDEVPEKDDYTTFCCNDTSSLKKGAEFPNCPKCKLAAGWRQLKT